MGNREGEKSSKAEKSSSPAAPEQNNFNTYPGWAAMQAYYGPRIALLPYYNPAVASGDAPYPYMWGATQPMAYGTPPYTTVYPSGTVYAHPAVPRAAIPLSAEVPTKSSGSTDRWFAKKLKGFDGLAMSIGNGGDESADSGAERGMLQSSDTKGFSDRSHGTTTGADRTRKERSDEETPKNGGDGKTGTDFSSPQSEDIHASTIQLCSLSASVKMARPVFSPGKTTELELQTPHSLKTRTSPATVPQPCTVLTAEFGLQNERVLKQEKRKQSNRESARRSRLRKQAEAEELSMKVGSLTAENVALKSERNRLTNNSEKLKLENATMMEILKTAGQMNLIVNKVDDSKRNVFSRVNNPDYADRSCEGENDKHDRNFKSDTKLYQLLDTQSRTNAVVAG